MQKRLFYAALLGLLLIALSGGPAGASSARAQTASRATVALAGQWIRQGQAGVVTVRGEGIADVRALFQGRLYHFYPEGSRYVGLLSVDVATDVKDLPLQVMVRYTDGTTEQIEHMVPINWGNYARGAVMLPGALLPLLDPEINNAEDSKMANIVGRFTAARYWAGGFVQPNPGDIVGYFGATRLYNDSYWYTHSGLDTAMPEGTPVTAAANGRVILSETLPIRGTYVLIDHGWGVYTGYAHLTQRLVVPGQWVHQGDVIGLSGNTGRSTGPHLHWEVAVGGVWVDPQAFLELGLTLDPAS
ncbi:MAG TPA: M23 family metallopeptidase [Aggregatilineaceae bacterium]|nr:M23 family metallopeptidase [Anaerolineae bacterium]HMM28363.1 M23 family metallopeptidase [Aggregatilineaceae bacterium]